MNWQGPADFFAMGGYGFYVWGSYAVTALVMFGEPALAALRRRRALRDAARALDDEQAMAEGRA